jgi:hypothetical protein
LRSHGPDAEIACCYEPDEGVTDKAPFWSDALNDPNGVEIAGKLRVLPFRLTPAGRFCWMPALISELSELLPLLLPLELEPLLLELLSCGANWLMPSWIRLFRLRPPELPDDELDEELLDEPRPGMPRLDTPAWIRLFRLRPPELLDDEPDEELLLDELRPPRKLSRF